MLTNPTMRDGGTPFRVGVDGYNLANARGTGVATYGRTLCRALHDIGVPLDLVYGVTVSSKAPPELREVLFYSRLASDESPPVLKWFSRFKSAAAHKFPHPFGRDMLEVPKSGALVVPELAGQVPGHDRLFTRSGLFRISAGYFRRYRKFMPIRVTNPPEIMHWTYPVPVRLEGARNIYTVHDLVPLRLPHTSLEDKAYYRRLLATCVVTADHLCTVSMSSRQDVIDLLGVAPERVTNTYQPADLPLSLLDRNELESGLQRLFGLTAGGYYLFFGAIEPKKNLGRLIEAYLLSGVTAPLVIVGAGGWRSERELRLLDGRNGQRLEESGDIRRFEYLPRNLLIPLIQGARCVVFPSLHEGFGLPALEAMALGTPVITTATSSLPEIVGDAALLVDPYDTGSLLDALRRVDADVALRTRLSEVGPQQAAHFNAGDYADRVLAMYRRVLAA